MSHILDSKVSFEELKVIAERASIESIGTSMLQSDLKTILPKDSKGNFLVETTIHKTGLYTAMYVPDGNYIKLNANRVESWVQNNANKLKDNFFIKNVKLFRGYLYLYLLAHEVEHSYQKQIALGYVNLNNPVIQGAYYHLLRQFKKDNSLFPKPISRTKKAIRLYNYRKKENEYVLERNAMLEGYDLLYRLANHYHNEELSRAFYCCRAFCCKIGYHNNPRGSFAETYQAMLMLQKYERIIEEKNFSEEEAVRYGLPVSEETRQKILTL